MNIKTILKEELRQLEQDIIQDREHEGQNPQNNMEIRLTGDTRAELSLTGSSEAEKQTLSPETNDILSRWAAAKRLNFESEDDFNRWAEFASKKIDGEASELFGLPAKPDTRYEAQIAHFEERLSARLAEFYQNEIMKQLLSK